jgi:hypothetical protein
LTAETGGARAWLRAALVAAGLASPAAWAHEPGASPVRAELGALPEALRGVTVEVAQTLAPQLLVANRGPEPLEILDDSGRAFIRIGPAGVEADLAAAAWYETLATVRPPVPAEARDPQAPPRWKRVKAEPEFGWFDPRLNASKLRPGEALRHADGPAAAGAWSVPVRIGGRAASIDGLFVFRPPEHGAYEASLQPPAGFPPTIGVRISQGATPGVFMWNRGQETVTVLGLEGEPTIRLSPAGVEVNTGSPTWRKLGREERASAETAGERWLKVSKQPAYTWLEPRGSTEADGRHEEKDWTVPVLVGDTRFDLRGVSVWRASAHHAHDEATHDEGAHDEAAHDGAAHADGEQDD